MRPSSNIASQSPAVPRYAWVVLAVAFIASVAAPVNMHKVPPLMPILMDTFQLELGQAGLLMSVFALTGALLALPAGIVIQKLGLKTAGLAAVGGLALGATLGAMAQNATMLLAGRVVEGFGMGLIAVVGPAAVAAWFPQEKQGIPMGIWSTWMPVGSVIMYTTAPRLASAAGWQSVWWVGAGFALGALVLYALFMRVPPRADERPDDRGVPNLWKALANRDIWLLTFVFFCFTLALSGITTYYPTFLHQVRGYTLAKAGSIASVSSMVVMGAAPLAGWLSDRLNTRRLVIVASYVAVGLLMLLPYHLTGVMIVVWMAVYGTIVGAIPTAVFAAAPEVMGDPKKAGIGLATIILGQNMGMMVGPILFAALVDALGWASAGYTIVPICFLAAAVAWRIRVR